MQSGSRPVKPLCYFRALAAGDSGVAQLRHGPCFVALHADPRYAAWVRRLGLEG